MTLYRHKGTVTAWQWNPPDPKIPAWMKDRFQVYGHGRRARYDSKVLRPGWWIVRAETAPYEIKAVWSPEEFRQVFEEVE